MTELGYSVSNAQNDALNASLDGQQSGYLVCAHPHTCPCHMPVLKRADGEESLLLDTHVNDETPA